MSSRPLRSFEFRSARNIHPDHERLLKALSEPVLKWKRDVDFPINNREFKIPKWSKTDKRASFNDIIPPPLSKETSSIKADIEDKVALELKETILKGSENIELDDSMHVDTEETDNNEPKESHAISSEIDIFDDSIEDVYQDLSAQNSASAVKVDESSEATQEISESNNTFQETEDNISEPTCKVQPALADLSEPEEASESNNVVISFVDVEKVTFTIEDNQLAVSQIQEEEIPMDEPNTKSSVDDIKKSNDHTKLMDSNDVCQIIPDMTNQSISSSIEMCIDGPVPSTFPLQLSQDPEDISDIAAKPQKTDHTSNEISASATSSHNQELISEVISAPDHTLLYCKKTYEDLSVSIPVPISKEQSFEGILDSAIDHHKSQASEVEPIPAPLQNTSMSSVDIATPECKNSASLGLATVDASVKDSLSQTLESLPISAGSNTSSEQVFAQDSLATKSTAVVEPEISVSPAIPEEASPLPDAPQNLK